MPRTIVATKATDGASGAVSQVEQDSLYEYSAYGMHLTSALRFPELGASHPSGAVSSMEWRLDVSSEPPGQLEDSRQLGEAEYAGGVRISLSRNHTTWELSTSDAGVWTFEPHEGRMHWHRDNVAGDAKGRFDALGRVMPLMLHATGALVLHGSSVATKHGGIALLGPKGRGKSTLAVACADAGAALAGDDVAVLRGGEQPMLYPSVGFARLHADSATDRKSTRLNSSHVKISYAVFCVKKKTQ